MKDPIDFVRQGAFIALSMICIQQNKTQTPKVESIRKSLQTVVSDKHEDSLAKFGAAISQGIIDAGGRNVTISMQSKAGTPHMNAIVGMTLFTQFWYWFPLAHCLSLSFQPTAIIGLDASLKVRVNLQSQNHANILKHPRCPNSSLSLTPSLQHLRIRRHTRLQ